MGTNQQRFSKKQGYSIKVKEITIREDAPKGLREYVLVTAYDKGFTPSPLRSLLCRVLRKLPDRSNWSEYPNIAYENQELIEECEWFFVYDIIEEIERILLSKGSELAKEFESEINDFFCTNGIGWQLINGSVETRGAESFEISVRGAVDILDKTGRPISMQEINEALKDLSRRPDPDLTGAIQHGMAALECVARDICSDPKLTLGQIIEKYRDIFPKPLDVSIEKAWGYASEMARHIKEGQKPSREEAELIVGLTAVLINYLIRKKQAVH
jgi:hypothetical protein